MKSDLAQIEKQLQTILMDFSSQVTLKKGQVMVIGCSTSEVMGERIGTSGTMEVASLIYDNLYSFAKKHGVHLAFQCCEHLNRALVVDRKVAENKGWEEVAVIPVRKAGGAMATYAYEHLEDPILVEFIKADLGMDIGDTFIGMHLKHVTVPVRASLNQIGSAHVTLAKTRPKLIGGPRAVYE